MASKELPGENYIMQDPARPGLCKLGKAFNSVHRHRTLKCGNPGLQLTGRFPFFNYGRSEKQIHRQFKSVREEGEWFRIPPEEATAYYELLIAEQVAVYGTRKDLQDFGINTGLIPLPARIPASKTPALKWLLDQTCPGFPSLTVASVIVQALGGSPSTSTKWAIGLRKVGLELQLSDKKVIFDKRKGGALEAMFCKGPARTTWRRQIVELAGFDGALKSVKINDWLKSTMSQQIIQKNAQS